MNPDFFACLAFALAVLCLALLVWNLGLVVQNTRLKLELFQRERWHERELAKWRQRSDL